MSGPSGRGEGGESGVVEEELNGRNSKSWGTTVGHFQKGKKQKVSEHGDGKMGIEKGGDINRRLAIYT